MILLQFTLGDNPWFQLSIALCMLFFCFDLYFRDNPPMRIQTNENQNSPLEAAKEETRHNPSPRPENVKGNHPCPLKERKETILNSTNLDTSVKSSLTSEKTTAPIQEIEDLEKWDVVLNNKRVKPEPDVVD